MHLGRKIRYYFLSLLWIALASGLSIRLIYLAAYKRDFLLGQSKARVERQMVLPARRGKIYDRNGEILGMSKAVNDLWTSPKLLLAEEGGVQKLAALLALKDEDLERKLEKNKHRDFLYLERNVDSKRYKEIKDIGVNSVYTTQSFSRFYPGGEASAQIIGFVNVDGAGLEGVEYMYDQALSGKSGHAKYLINPFGETVESITRQEPVAGKDIYLTIDKSIQYMAYEALKEGVQRTGAKSAHALVLEVGTGNILAATNYPSFDPERGSEKGGRSSHVRNGIFTDLFEPGSTLKPISLAYVMDSQSLPENAKTKTSPGELKIGVNTVKDGRDFGELTLEDILIKSSNVGISKLILDSPREFVSWLKMAYGVGEKNAKIFPGEPTSTTINKPDISNFELATLSFGYGLSMTPIHLGKLYLSIANGGLLQPVSLISESKKTKEVPLKRVLSSNTAKKIKEILHKATLNYGTARRAAVSGFKVAGKTGTTHLYENGKYHNDRHIASFAGFFPYENPKHVVVIIVEEPVDFGLKMANSQILYLKQLLQEI